MALSPIIMNDFFQDIKDIKSTLQYMTSTLQKLDLDCQVKIQEKKSFSDIGIRLIYIKSLGNKLSDQLGILQMGTDALVQNCKACKDTKCIYHIGNALGTGEERIRNNVLKQISKELHQCITYCIYLDLRYI